VGFRPFVASALEVLGRAAQWPDARKPVNASPTDNVISALGKIAVGQERPDLLPAWLALLPLTRDDGEAHDNHMRLCSLVEANHPNILGADMAGFPHVVRVCCTLLSGQLKDLEIDADLETKLTTLLRRFKQEQGGALLEAVLSQMPAKEQKRARGVVSSC
jgi:hypothetical protein